MDPTLGTPPLYLGTSEDHARMKVGRFFVTKPIKMAAWGPLRSKKRALKGGPERIPILRGIFCTGG